MRIRKIQIEHWRHFEGIDLQLDDNASIVCIVGANGTGKSHLLELVASCAHSLGLAAGIDIPRGDPFADNHKILFEFYFAEGVSPAIEELLAKDPAYASWDRTITISSERTLTSFQRTLIAGGVSLSVAARLAQLIANTNSESHDVNFLSLDADRAYPKQKLNVSQLAEAYQIDWSGREHTKGKSFKTTASLYDEWKKYFLGRENKSASEHIKQIRRARENDTSEPRFQDHFDAYKASLSKVLPHLTFVGVEPNQRSLLFDTTGLELNFNQLSGGEREIAFLIGQIDRFGLRRGLLLVDEPELHLNSDLIRAWVGYLRQTVETGQIWLATHSLEAVEAAGRDVTFILQRDDVTRKVNQISRLEDQPVISALSRAVGSPAFSISTLAFFFVEGEEGIGERERYKLLTNAGPHVRFIECGSCNEVMRRISVVESLASASSTPLRIAGVIDRDFRSDADCKKIANFHTFILAMHEVENFFLHPHTLDQILRANGVDSLPNSIVCEAADARAGSWIFQHAMATEVGKSLPPIVSTAKEIAKSLKWFDFDTDSEAAVEKVLRLTSLDVVNRERFAAILRASIARYTKERQTDTLWKKCEGKQVLPFVAKAAGFNGPSAFCRAVFATWSRDPSLMPAELVELRSCVGRI